MFSEPNQTSNIKSNIKDGVFRQNIYRFLAVKFFYRELHLRYFTGFRMDSAITIKAESSAIHNPKSLTEYLKQTFDFLYNSVPREKFHIEFLVILHC